MTSFCLALYASRAHSALLQLLRARTRAVQPPQFVFENNEDVASPRDEHDYLEAQALPTPTSKAAFAASAPTKRLSPRYHGRYSILRPNAREDDCIEEKPVSDDEVFRIDFLLCACTAIAQGPRAKRARLQTPLRSSIPNGYLPRYPSEICVKRPLTQSPPNAGVQSEVRTGCARACRGIGRTCTRADVVRIVRSSH